MTNAPFLNPNEVRKVTRKNIASLFATLMHLMQLSGVVYHQRLLSFSGIVYNRILSIFDISALVCISELKLVRRWYLEYIRGGCLDNPGLEEDRWDTSNNCPFLLSGLHEFWEAIDKEDDTHHTDFAAQILFSLLSIDRIIVTPARPNHSTITEAAAVQPSDIPSEKEIWDALLALGINPAQFREKFNEEVHNFNFEVLTSRGPNGDATWTAHLDALAWSYNSTLLSTFKTWLEECKLTVVLRNLLGCVSSALHEVIPNLNPILGKLAYIEEWGGKARIVAQLDYWTQAAMTPLHNTINHFLRLLPQDGTFNQHAVADRVRVWTTDSNLDLYCFDLTAATDRLPLIFQRDILSVLMGSTSWAKNWADILVGREFLTQNGDYIKYATGQPMGARSSFPMLALTHHVIIQIAAQRADAGVYSNYVVLGDDSAMCGLAVADAYRNLMAKLDVPINLTKSILHVKDALSMAEICKRVFMDGVEISVFNPKLIVKTIMDGRLAPDLQNDLFIRGWKPQSKVFWEFMSGILDMDNLVTLIKLNIAPISITGLLSQHRPETKLVDFKTWIPSFSKLEGWMLVELFTYVTASEALKRLDTLLRATITINDSIAIIAAANANPKAIPQFVRDDWLRQDLSEDEIRRLEEIINGAGPITPNHPIVLASRSEANRISELLHSLNAQDANMVARARAGLLDTFRTSVSSIWIGDTSISAGENRALFVRMLSTLIALFTSDKRVSDNVRNLSLSYSVVLSTIGRLWTVALTFGGTCTINALRATITRNINNAAVNYSEALKELSILPSEPTSSRSSHPISARAQKRRNVVRKQSKNSP